MNNRANNPTLTITGDTDSSGRFIVLFNEEIVKLPQYRFLALLVLINARLCTLSGRTELMDFERANVIYGKTALHKLIQRLRNDLDLALGAECGYQLVPHNGLSRYSVAIDRAAICVAPAFRELKRDIPQPIFHNLEALIVESDAGICFAERASSCGTKVSKL